MLTNINNILTKIIFVLFIIFLNHAQGQDEVLFPLINETPDDYSSSYGPRYLDTHTNNYDFHAGIDIGASEGTDVYAIRAGVVHSVDPYDWVIIKHTDSGGDYLVLYMHISSSLATDESVTVNTVIGTVKYHSGGSHLDIRYVEEDHFDWGTFPDCLNPGRILANTNISPDPVAVYDDLSTYGGVINGSYSFEIEEDSRGKYIKIGARVEDNELDFDEIEIHMLYDTGTLYWDEWDLLDRSSIAEGHGYNYVRYETRNNVGDQIVADDDHGDISSSVVIEPKNFLKTNDYHVVYFKWYFNQTKLNQIPSQSEILLEILLWDWKADYPITINNIPIYTCIGCDPPSGVPGIPNLTTGVYNSGASTITLNWLPSGPNAYYYKIYRCEATRALTNSDEIGISSTNQYVDDDPDLILGTEYRYAVAGVNLIGEGLNSNEKIVLFATPTLSLTISGPTYLAWKQSGTFSVTANNGISPYSFHWYRKMDYSSTWYDLYTGTTKTMSGDRSGGFTLKVIGTDNNGLTGEDLHHVSGGILDPFASDGLNKLEKIMIPDEYELNQNFPNPFNPSTTIKFGLPESDNVTLEIYNTLGEKVRTLINESRGPGYHKVIWNGTDASGSSVSSGMYLYVLKTNSQRIVKKMFFMK